GALHARRQGLRLQLEHTHEGHRALCRNDGAPLSYGGQAAGVEPTLETADPGQIPPSTARRRPAGVVLIFSAQALASRPVSGVHTSGKPAEPVASAAWCAISAPCPITSTSHACLTPWKGRSAAWTKPGAGRWPVRWWRPP